MIIETNKGWSEAIINNDCGFDRFYQAAEVLERDFDIKFSDQLDDFDSLYWNFSYKGSALVLHYNIYFGLTLFPRNFKLASELDNEMVVEMGALLFQKMGDQ